MEKYYVATVSTEFQGFIRRGKSIKSLMSDINSEFGKGWFVEIWEVECEEDEISALQFENGKCVKSYTKRK